jgi:ACS family hexuronate transporter-like MFS transporter
MGAWLGAVGAIVFNTYVGRMMETIGSSRIFLVMAVLQPLAAVILWTMTRPERPSNSFVESECAVETASSSY